MSNLLDTILSDAGNNYLKQQGVPVTINSSGTGISLATPVQASQMPGVGLSLTGTGDTAPSPAPALSTAPIAQSVKNIGRWALAFMAFLAVLMFLKPVEAGWLSLIVVLGALVANADNAAKAGRPTVIQTVLGG